MCTHLLIMQMILVLKLFLQAKTKLFFCRNYQTFALHWNVTSSQILRQILRQILQFITKTS